MEAGGHRFAKESQRGVAVGTVTQIAEDLIEGTVFLHHIDNVLDFGMKEFHCLHVLIGVLGQVSVVGCYL